MAFPASRRLSVAEYLEFENASEIRHEYYDGEIFAMSGASLAHADICSNAAASLHAQLKGTPCRTHSADTRIRVEATGLHCYPDVVVICGDVQRAPDDAQTFLNPKVIVEVLSPSTQRYDRTTKIDNYRQIPSLIQILLIEQDSRWVASYRRSGEDWLYESFSDPAESIPLPAISAALSLVDIYDRVEIPPAEALHKAPDGGSELKSEI